MAAITMFDVSLLSREAIKPSTPTPHHLGSYNLSLFDQLSPQDHIPVVLFYSSIPQISSLKDSLSRTLTRFFPFAGEPDGCNRIKCSDRGVDFFQAKAHGQLSKFLQHQQQETELLFRLLPCHTCCAEKPEQRILLSVQVTSFDCGGAAVAICAAHKLCDGISVATFLNSWAAETRGDGTNNIAPDFTAPSLFRQVDAEIPSTKFESDTIVDDDDDNKLVVKRLVFDGPAIAKLKSTAAAAGSRPPSRVEAVYALLWRCIVRARVKIEAKSTAMAVHFIDLRRRMAPPLPQRAFGNVCTVAVASTATADGLTDVDESYCGLEEQLRMEVGKVDEEYARQLQGPEGAMWAMSVVGEAFGAVGGVDRYLFSSWCGFKLYEADFAGGGPVWATPVGMPSEAQKNSVILMDTRDGGGVEAWMTMEAREFQEIQKDERLLRHLIQSVDSS